MPRKRSNPKKPATKCDLHNRFLANELLTPAELTKLGFCKEPIAHRCKKTDCPYHIEALEPIKGE